MTFVQCKVKSETVAFEWLQLGCNVPVPHPEMMIAWNEVGLVEMSELISCIAIQKPLDSC
jgi:hypothetical protein